MTAVLLTSLDQPPRTLLSSSADGGSSPNKRTLGRNKNVAVCFRGSHAAHEPDSVLEASFAKHSLSGAGLAMRATSGVRGGLPAPDSRSDAEKDPTPAHVGLPAH